MKMRRRTGVNGVRENHRDTVVNQGGTARSLSVPYREGRLGFLRKNTGQDTSQKKQNREEEEENIMAKEKNCENPLRPEK